MQLKKIVNDDLILIIGKINPNDKYLDLLSSLSDYDLEILKKKTNSIVRHQFLCVRDILLKNDISAKIKYRNSGKPYLEDGRKISISHSNECVGFVISKNHSFGLDIEKYDKKILNIRQKFLHIDDYRFIDQDQLIESLTSIWCAKESIYKLSGKSSTFYSENLFVISKSGSKLVFGLKGHSADIQKFESNYYNTINFCVCLTKEI